MKDKSSVFLAWMCPLLKTRIAVADEHIYYENDLLSNIYFLKTGSCNYVLPKFSNTPFIRVEKNTCFGLIDFVASLLNKSQAADLHSIMHLLDTEEDHKKEYEHEHDHDGGHEHDRE